MRSVIALLVLGFVAAVLSAPAPQKAPAGQLENIDVDSLLKNKKYVETQIKCVLSEGKCDKTGRDLKALLPDALQRNCSTCSAVQKVNSDKIIDFMRKNHPSDWTKIDVIYRAVKLVYTLQLKLSTHQHPNMIKGDKDYPWTLEITTGECREKGRN